VSAPFQDKRVLLGVSGSIAAYKAVDLASKLTQAGAEVDVLLTYSGSHFVTPLTFRSVTHRAVVTDLFDLDSPEALEHVAQAVAADVLVVAPATAHMIAKLANGFADDPISVTALATKAPLVIAPAMDASMWDHAAVKANMDKLEERGAVIVGPGRGRLASGLYGWGRLAETTELLGRVAQVLGTNADMVGRAVVVTAGGTQEPIDPVRVISNRSSGKMGYAVAEAARDRGASVVLIAAPTALDDPPGIQTVHVETAEEMRTAVLDACKSADALVMAAAVADYRPSSAAGTKIKKAGDSLSIDLVKTPDILAESPRNIIRVGFAAESNDLLYNAREKLVGKGLDLIVANDITLPEAGFGADTNKVTILDAKLADDLPLMSKYEVGARIIDRIVTLLTAHRPSAV
jgi:phosphopantothenoylcysteine decarboxylase/phosphopantothenate--cysteine ligase